MSLAGKNHQLNLAAVLLHDAFHILRLIQRYHVVLLPLEHQQGGLNLVRMVAGAPVVEDPFALLVRHVGWEEEVISILAFKLVGVLTESPQVGDAVQRVPAGEERGIVAEGLENGVAPCATAANSDLIPVDPGG